MKTQSCQCFSALAFLTVVVAALGCNGVGNPTSETASQQQLPFAQTKPMVVPANTILYVRLREPITSGKAQAGQNFTAVLDEPLLVDSQIAVPQGAEIGGKIVVARESGRLHAGGYVRITLSSLILNGKTVAMQTNSAIAGGGRFKNRDLSFMRGGVGSSLSHSFQASESDPAVSSGKEEAGFPANLRIAFRLTQPLDLG
jgi:hypothetical protein